MTTPTLPKGEWKSTTECKARVCNHQNCETCRHCVLVSMECKELGIFIEFEHVYKTDFPITVQTRKTMFDTFRTFDEAVEFINRTL